MNKNKFSQFLLSASAGVVVTFSVSEINAIADVAAFEAAMVRDAEITAANRAEVIGHISAERPELSPAQVNAFADEIFNTPHGMNAVFQNAKFASKALVEILEQGHEITSSVVNGIVRDAGQAQVLEALGLDSVRELGSPSVERRVVPNEITTEADAVYFANQRKASGDFEQAAEFFVKARTLVDTQDPKAQEYGEQAMLMYNEYFIHHVARASSVTQEGVTAAQTLLATVRALAEDLGSDVAYRRAANCAAELGTAIHDLITAAERARNKLTVEAEQVAAAEPIANMYVDLYKADIHARDMHEKAASKLTGDDKNKATVAASNAMRLGIGALADAVRMSNTAAMLSDGNSVLVLSKLKAEADDFYARYESGWGTGGLVNEKVQRYARRATVMKHELKALDNARSAYARGSAERNAFSANIATLEGNFDTLVTEFNTFAAGESPANKAIFATDEAVIKEVKAEFLYRNVLDIDTNDAANLGAGGVLDLAVEAVRDYVRDMGSVNVLNTVDTQMTATSDETELSALRTTRAAVSRSLALERSVVAKAYAFQQGAAVDVLTTAQMADRLEVLLEYARLASNRKAWEDTNTAMTAVLANAAVAAAANDADRLANVLAKAAKSEALLSRNTSEADEMVAKLTDGAFDTGLLFDAYTTANANTDLALRTRARRALRTTFARTVELYNDTTGAVQHGVRSLWHLFENTFAIDVAGAADLALVAAPAAGAAYANTTLHQQNGATWAAILEAFEGAANAAAIRTAIRTALFGVADGANTLIDGADAGGAETLAAKRAALVANTLATYFNNTDWDNTAGAAAALAADHAWNTVEGLYADLKAEYDRITGLAGTPYAEYAVARDAWKTAATAAAAWAERENAGLSAVPDANFEATRDNISEVYELAANYHAVGSFAAVAASGQGVMLANNVALAGAGVGVQAAQPARMRVDLTALTAAMAANNGRLAAAYVTEDLLSIFKMRADYLQSAARVFQAARPDAVGGAIAAGDAQAIVQRATIGANVGAYEVFTGLVTSALEGVSRYNDDANLAEFVGRRMEMLQAAYASVNSKWLPSLSATASLLPNAQREAIVDAIVPLLSTGAAGAPGAVAAGATAAGRAFELAQTIALDNWAGSPWVSGSVVRVYETVARTLRALGTTTAFTDASRDTRLTHLYDAATASAVDAAGRALPAPAQTSAATNVQLAAHTEILGQLADAAQAAAAAAYAATGSTNASDATFAPARAVAVDTEAARINVRIARDTYMAAKAIGLGATVTAADKAEAAGEFGRVLAAVGEANEYRFVNVNESRHKDAARAYYLEAAAAYADQIAGLRAPGVSSNADLIRAYARQEDAYRSAIRMGDSSSTEKADRAKLERARLLYREGDRDTSARLLSEMRGATASALMHEVLDELASQYQSEGHLTKAAKTYAEASMQSTALGNARDAFKMAKRAYNLAGQTASAEAYASVVDAFNAIGVKVHPNFHGHLRAEAYHEAARAAVDAMDFVAASTAYEQSAKRWAKIGDHRHSGGHYEKAAWALGKIADISMAQRLRAIQLVGKGANQLQQAEATRRLERMSELAEVHIAAIEASADDAKVAFLREAMVAAAEVLYEKALAFARDQKMEKAAAAEDRVREFLDAVDGQAQEGVILVKLGQLEQLQADALTGSVREEKLASATNNYIDGAAQLAEANMLLDAAKAYNLAARAAAAARQGSRVRTDIIAPMTALSAAVRTAGNAAKGTALQHDIHIEVLDALAAFADAYPAEAVESAKTELASVKAEAGTSTTVQKARIAAIEVGLLRLEAKSLDTSGVGVSTTPDQLLTQARAVFDVLKAMTSGVVSENLDIKRYVVQAASQLADMYAEQSVLSVTDAAAFETTMVNVKDVLNVARTSALEAVQYARDMNRGYSGALNALKQAAFGVSEIVRSFATVFSTRGGVLPIVHTNYMLGLAASSVELGEQAARVLLLGVLTEREEARAMKVAYADVMNSLYAVNVTTKAIRSSSEAHKAGEEAKAAKAQEAASGTAEKVTVALGNVDTAVADAQKTDGVVERADAVKAAVDSKVDTIVAHVKEGLSANADVSVKAPVVSAEVRTANEAAMADHSQAVIDAVTKAADKISDVQAAPTAQAQAVVNKR